MGWVLKTLGKSIFRRFFYKFKDAGDRSKWFKIV